MTFLPNAGLKNQQAATNFKVTPKGARVSDRAIQKTPALGEIATWYRQAPFAATVTYNRSTLTMKTRGGPAGTMKRLVSRQLKAKDLDKDKKATLDFVRKSRSARTPASLSNPPW